MVFNATCNNISVLSWRSDLLVEETGVSGETTDLPQVIDKFLSHNVASSTQHLSGIRIHLSGDRGYAVLTLLSTIFQIYCGS